MTNCKYFIPVTKHLSTCKLLEDEFGVKYIPSLTRSGNPCKGCQAEWISGELPTKDNLTSPIKLILQANGKIALPTITEQFKNLTQSIIGWAGNGFKNVPENEADRRIKICESNVCGLFEKEERRCTGCGCFVDLKVKYSHEECPAEYWGQKDLGAETLNNAPQGCGSCGKR